MTHIRRHSWRLGVGLLAAAMALVTAVTLAATPTTVAVHGSLRAADGGAAADGKYLATFRLYATVDAKQPLFVEVVDSLTVASGRFAHPLGSNSELAPKTLAAAPWLGLQIANEPEAARVALNAAPFALRAQLAGGLACTACLPMAALVANGDLDLGGNAVKAKQLAVAAIIANSVNAALVGDGAKITGVVPPAESCPAGQLVTGVKADGKLICQGGGAVGDDGLATVSGGLLTTTLASTNASGTTPKAIMDNNPVGTVDEITVDDVGLVKNISVSVKLNNSNLGGVEVLLYDPANAVYVLHKNTPGKALDETWPVTAKTISGDLLSWVGKNPKGKWRLRIIDMAFLNNGNDGELVSWAINLNVKANNLISSAGQFAAAGGFGVQKSAGPPYPCTAKVLGGQYYDSKTMRMYYCDGEWRELLTESLCGNGVINSTENCDDGNTKDGDGCTASCQKNVCGDGVIWVGHEQCDDGNVVDGDGCDSKCQGGVFSCAAWKVAGAAKDGEYLVDPDAAGPLKPFKAFCEMDLDGGGWTLVMNLNTSDGNVSSLAGKIWTDKAEYGAFANRWNKDYKSPAALHVKAKALLLIIRNSNDAEGANPIGWRSWNLAGEKRFQDFFDVAMGDACANKTGGCNGGHSGAGTKQTTGIKSQGVKAKWDTFTGFASNIYTNSYYGCCGSNQDGFRISSWYRWANNSNVGVGLQMDSNSFANYSLEAGTHMLWDTYNNPQRFCGNCGGCQSCPEGNCQGSSTKAAIGSDHYNMHCSVGVSYRYEWYVQ